VPKFYLDEYDLKNKEAVDNSTAENDPYEAILAIDILRAALYCGK